MSALRGSVGRRVSWSIVSGVIAAAALVVVSVLPADAVGTTPFSTNLVKNPGAEAGPASNDPDVGIAIPNWETLDNFTVVAYGTGGGFPSTTEGSHIHGGNQFFSAGEPEGDGGCDDAIQFIKIKGHNSDIDAGHVQIILKARLGTFDSQTDTAVVTLQFRDANNEQVGGSSAGLKLKATQTGQTMLQKSASKIMPRHAREVRIILAATNTTGYCDAYFDNMSVEIVSA